MSFDVLKTNGQTQQFNAEKVRKSILRAGADPGLADSVVDEVESRGNRVKDLVTTQQIYKWVNAILSEKAPGISMRYDLRDALLRLGPTGFPFEKYVAAIMKEYGYKTELPEILQGACITHEVDVAMEKDNRFMMVEAKFRKRVTINVGIKDTMSTWARFLDLVEGASLDLAPRFDEAWIVTNASFSDQSLQYGHCKNMVMIGWNHPHQRPLAKMIDLKKLYPITIIKDMATEIRDVLVENDILLCSQIPEIISSQHLPLSETKRQALQRDCELILEGPAAEDKLLDSKEKKE